ncbi:Proton-dependent oligopeptide transporter family, partial [Dillenia turbinata]
KDRKYTLFSVLMEEDKTVSAHEVAINYRGMKAMPFVIGNEIFEKLGTTGTSSNLLVYLTTVFNMKSVTGATLLSIIGGTSNVVPLLGGFLSDSYFGRYKTLGFACVSTFVGMTLLVLTAAIPQLHPPHCQARENTKCIGSTVWQLAILLCAFVFLTIGAGGIRPCNLAFGADQFNPKSESGKKEISSFFNWYYFTFTFSVMVSVTLIVYIQSNISWAIGLGIPAVLMFISCVLFFSGSRIYVKVKPEGSPLITVAQVLVAAYKKRHLKLPKEDPTLCLFNYIPTNSMNSKLPYTHQFRFLNKSAVIASEDRFNLDGSAANPWKLCSIQEVEGVKCIIRVIPIWASAILYHIAIAQQQIYAVFQALQSDRRLGSHNFNVPAASYAIFAMLSLTLWIPIYDQILIPLLRRFTGKEHGITLLQRMGTGILLSSITSLVSGFVELKRRNLALTRPALGIAPKGGTISSMSAFWLAPQLTLAGLCEAFAAIGQIEFYYRQFPENMRSIAMSFFFLGIACASYLNSFLVNLVQRITSKNTNTDWLDEDLNKGKLDYFYYMIAASGVLNFGYFVICAKWYKYKGDGDSTHKVEAALKTKEESHRHIV